MRLPGHADFGSYSGSSDYGGGDYGSSYSGGYDSGSSYSSYDSSGLDIGGLLLYLIMGIIGLMAARLWRKMKKRGNLPPGASPTEQSKLLPMEQYCTHDPGFDQGVFCEKLSNLYVQMQNCWTDRDIEPVRPYFTDAMWSQMDRQTEIMKQQGRTNYVEQIAVLGVALRGFYQSGGEDHMIASLNTRIVDYTLDDKTGKVVSGDRSREKFMTYEWELTRPTGTVTSSAGGTKVVNCPNCGAPVSLNESAKCPYCGSLITVAEHDWAICAIKGISQQTR